VLKNTPVISKLLGIIFLISAIFFGTMIAWFYLLPVETYALKLAVAQSQVQKAQEELADRTDVAQTGLDMAKTENEALQLQLQEAKGIHASAKERIETLRWQIEDIKTLPNQILQVREEYGNAIRQLEELIMAGQSDVKICYLTFDDGPNSMTGAILEELEKQNVYATFFTIGSNTAPNQEENLRAEMMGGHTVANHTYSHAYYGPLYKSLESFQTQVLKQDAFVYETTGFHMDILRFPSGSSACHFLDEAETWLKGIGYQWIDWNANAYDAGMHALDDTSIQVKSRMVKSCENLEIAVLLCHDFNVGTYGALKLFVPEMQEQGYVFLPLLPQSHMFDEPLPVV